jgi:hypothetical protein
LFINERLETVLDQIENKVNLADMKMNFKTLTDMLFVKFRQLEDTKSGMRDMLTYTKYFLPMEI